jgi:DNA-binding MarR family transcriptional regulator
MLHLPGLDLVEQTCWHEFLETSIRLLAELDSRLKELHGLTLFDVIVLDLLARGAIRKSELAHAFMQTPGQVALQIRSLKNKGLVGYWPTRYDPRAVLVSITHAGRARVEAARKTYAEEVRTHYLDRMSHQQMIALADTHRRINTPLRASVGSARWDG